MLLVLLAFLGGKVPDAHSAEDCAREAARVVSVEGAVHLRSAHGETWRAAEPSAVLCAGDQVRVGARSRAALVLRNETTLRLDQSSTLTLRGDGLEGSSLLELLSGALHVITRTPQPFKVKTPYVNAAVDGTEFLVDVSPDEARVAVYEGRVSASNEFGILSLIAGEIALVAKNQAPRKEIMVRPVDAVQWALYYPNIIEYRLDDATRGSAAAPALRESIDMYRQGRLAEAILRTDHAPEGRNDARFLTYRAGLLLMVGRVDEAKPEIRHALALDPHFSAALALDSIIAVVQNDKEQALTLATKAVEFDPSSPAARMALSYAQQAHFKIEEATASVLKALELEPNSALAWARVAELQMSSGELDLALKSAQRAVQLDPGIAKTQSVLGFAHLTRFDTKAAKQTFGKAIELDQGEPLARLGLGLAKIREGDLVAGREEIEIAVSLDPGNSLIRSYMGKAYYEEKRDRLAGGQFVLAKRYDPRDPTPWFYDAIRKQTENRPVEALQDLEKSIALNDNRAVYRSRLLLDQDLAARTANLARLYSDLGFNRVALIEGYRSLRTDPTSSSAHRFVADSYLSQSRHDIARLSEILQAQLRQPINASPLQPQLSTDKIFVLNGTGPAGLGFNEYNQLYTRNGSNILIDGVVGGNNTLGDQLVFSGIHNNQSYSLGQFHFETDGYRQNNDLKRDVLNAFAMNQVSDRVYLQAEYRRSSLQRGDLPLRFDSTNFSSRRAEENARMFRVGARLLLDDRSDLLATAEFDTGYGLATTPQTILDIKRKIAASEIQHSFLSKEIALTSGAGYYRVTSRILLNSSEIEQPVESHGNVYSYCRLNLVPETLQLELGLSHDQVNYNGLRFGQTNPKLGVTWSLLPATTLRAAYFDTVKRVYFSGQTLEPTQIAGFNQLFDDPDGTQAKRAGFAIDQKIGKTLFTGVELTGRELRLPPVIGDPNSGRPEWSERTHRGYAYWAPNDKVALTAEYQYDKFTRLPEDTGNEDFLNVSTYRIPVGFTVFWNSLLSTRLMLTNVKQSGIFVSAEGEFFSAVTRFWTTDAALTYRFPRRKGLLALEVRNLFDRRFRLQETDNIPEVPNKRLLFVRLSLTF